MIKINFNGVRFSIESNKRPGKATVKPLIVKCRDAVALGGLVKASGLDLSRIFTGRVNSMVYLTQDEGASLFGQMAIKLAVESPVNDPLVADLHGTNTDDILDTEDGEGDDAEDDGALA